MIVASKATSEVGLVPTGDQPQLLRRKRSVDGTLGSRYSLRFTNPKPCAIVSKSLIDLIQLVKQ